MKRNSILRKSTSFLLLTVMMYMHLCSALCAAGSSGCCGKKENKNDHHKKSCCQTTKENDGKKHDCQDMHFAFFNTTGQFASEKSVDAINPFQTFIAFVIPVFNELSVSQNKNAFAYYGFHPPPPKKDIRIFIRSFQI